MKTAVILILTLAIGLGCATPLPRFEPRTEKFSNEEKNRAPSLTKKIEAPYRNSRIPSSSKLKAPAPRLSGIQGSALLPTYLNIKDRSPMVLIDSGEYLIGILDKQHGTIRGPGSSPRRQYLLAFYIDRTEITVEQFQRFDSAYDEKPFTGKRECPQCPAMGIDWDNANRYCLWAKKRLPTEAEWEASARGNSSDPWPWGNAFLAGRANLQGNGDGHYLAAPVASFPMGASPYGVLDMIGNVWEWVGDAAFSSGKTKPETKKGTRIAKGGGWTSRPQSIRISNRNQVDPTLKIPTFGFRCVKPLTGNRGKSAHKKPAG